MTNFIEVSISDHHLCGEDLKSSMKNGMIIEDIRVFLGTEWFQRSSN